MNDQEILAGLGEIVEEIAGVPADEVTPSKSFVDDLDIDSLSMVEIAVAAQDKFGVEIPDDQLKDLSTVQDVVNFVSKNAGRLGVTAGRETVVVTGLGATTPLGGDVASTWSAMLEGRSGVRRLTEPWAEDLPVRIAAVAAADPAEVVGRVQARRMDRCEQLALVAAREAWADAGTPEVDPERLGVAVTSGIGGIGSTLAAYDTLKEKGWQRISPYTVPMLMPNGSAGWISMEIGARAGAHSLVSACASGAEAIGYGIDMIRSGRADVVLAGGTEAAIMPLNIGAFAVMRAMSTRNDEPERASRPFDKARDGFVLGEGAGMLVLESLSHARQRDATVYAIAAGAGYSSDAYHIAHPAPDGAGVIAAITRALADAQVDPTGWCT